jgi:hypothetical protein
MMKCFMILLSIFLVRSPCAFAESNITGKVI